MKELLGEGSDAEEEAPVKTKRLTKEDDNMSDLLGSDEGEGSMGSDEEDEDEMDEDEEAESEIESENGNDNGADSDTERFHRFKKKGTRVSEKKVLLAQGKKPSKHSARGTKGKVFKAKTGGRIGTKRAHDTPKIKRR